MKLIAVIGAGNSGLAMAGHLSLCGYKVNLWSRSQETLEPIRKSKKICLTGSICGTADISEVSNDMSMCLHNVDIIFITTPANAHRDIAQITAKHINSEQIIILNPGRTFGALEFSEVLRENGCHCKPLIAETQTIIYTCRKTGNNSVNIITLKRDVLISVEEYDLNNDVVNRLPLCLKHYFKPARSIIETSFGNVGMILHSAPVLLNSGWIESPNNQFKYYYDGITPSIAGLLEKLDKERLLVAENLGCPVESTSEWLKRSYGVDGKNLFECIRNNNHYRTIDAPSSLQHRYIFEDINCGLVCMESCGKHLGIPMRICGLIIDLASEILNVDFRSTGRHNMITNLKPITLR